MRAPEVAMRWIRVALLSLFLLFVQNAVAGELQVIELTDGSRITGEVVSLVNGVYTIKSDSLGTVRLGASKVRLIRAQSAGASASPSQEARALQEKMLSDEEIMSLIQSLQDDPDFQKVLEDPEIMKAVNAGDIPALIANPQFMKLLNNATVEKIRRKTQ